MGDEKKKKFGEGAADFFLEGSRLTSSIPSSSLFGQCPSCKRNHVDDTLCSRCIGSSDDWEQFIDTDGCRHFRKKSEYTESVVRTLVDQIYDLTNEVECHQTALKKIRELGWATEETHTRKNLADIANEALISKGSSHV